MVRGVQSVNANGRGIRTELVERVCESGAAVFPAVFEPDQIAWAREVVLSHREFMPNTRPTRSSRHLAGFHRFPALEPLHVMMTGNEAVRSIVENLCGPGARTIGLSDITVNRSQQWHKDLLRGEFRRHLGEGPYCPRWHGSVFKVIVYLQDSASLRIVPGSHRTDIDLENDDGAIPDNESNVVMLPVNAGDAVVIDICTTHRGSVEEAFASPNAEADPKILVSTVFGRQGAPLTDRMEQGNAMRLSHWMSTHLGVSERP
jgi:hypothetical protein